jgi:hypothetical protein
MGRRSDRESPRLSEVCRSENFRGIGAGGRVRAEQASRLGLMSWIGAATPAGRPGALSSASDGAARGKRLASQNALVVGPASERLSLECQETCRDLSVRGHLIGQTGTRFNGGAGQNDRAPMVLLLRNGRESGRFLAGLRDGRVVVLLFWTARGTERPPDRKRGWKGGDPAIC